MAMHGPIGNSSYPYVSVSMLTINNPIPMNPLVGQGYHDVNGQSWVWDGMQWRPMNNYNGYNPHNNYNTYNNTYNNMYNTVGASTVGSDISIFSKKGRIIYVGEMIDRIMARLGMIDPDHELMDKYPSVKAAYEEYEKEFAAALAKQFPDLKAAIDSYNMVVSLVKTDDATD